MWECAALQPGESTEIITEILRQEARGLGGERDMEEQGGI